jgi:hypothetical protein
MENKDRNNTINRELSSPKIVCVYAQNDEIFYSELQKYLSLWQREGYIQWLEISAGSDVEYTMQAHLRQAQLILLLVSPDFFAQDHCYRAMQFSLEERARRQVPVVPILVRASAWKGSVCGGLRALPGNEQPIAEWAHPEQAYEEVRGGLVHLLSGDMSLRQKLIQENAHHNLDTTSRQEREVAQQRSANAQSATVTFNNKESKIGQQGNFYGPITNNF